MAARVRCIACGTYAVIRQVVGPRPAHFNHRRARSRVKEAAMREIFDRLGQSELNDAVDDLWQTAPGDYIRAK
jgi:hypothetical protein